MSRFKSWTFASRLKNNKSSQRELWPSVFQCDRIVQICLLLARPSFWSRNDTKLPKPWKNVVKFIEHVLHVSKTCHVSLTNIHCFVLQTKHFHWPSRYSCLGNCLVWKINMCGKTFTLHGWTQMAVLVWVFRSIFWAFCAYVRLHSADHSDLGITGKVFSSCRSWA